MERKIGGKKMKSGNHSSQSVPMYTFKRTTGQQVGTHLLRRPPRKRCGRPRACGSTRASSAWTSIKAGKLETTALILIRLHCIQTSKIKDQKTCSGQFNTQHDPSMYVHSVVGTGRCTMSTTTMHILITEFTYNELAWC